MRRTVIGIAVGVVLGALMTVAVQTVAEQAPPGTPPLADYTPCAVYMAALDPTGALTPYVVGANGVSIAGADLTSGVDVSATPFISDSRLVQEGPNNAGSSDANIGFFSSFFVRPDGHLSVASWAHRSSENKPPVALSVTSILGWANFKVLVDTDPGRETFGPRFLYGLDKSGVLHRYLVKLTAQDTPAITADGTLTGLSHVKGLALIARRPTYDVLLANLTSGALIALSLPHSTPFTHHNATIRTSGWQNFDSLIISPCDTGSAVVGYERTGHTFYYELAHLNGTATRIDSAPASSLLPSVLAGDIVTSYDGARSRVPTPLVGA